MSRFVFYPLMIFTMTINEKIIQEKGKICLYKEGIFWVAYEQSAYAVWLRKKYKPKKKYVKSAGMEIVSIGFPQSALVGVVGTGGVDVGTTLADTHEHDFRHLRQGYPQGMSQQMVIPNNVPFSEEEFQAWKTGISLKTRCDAHRRDAACHVSASPPAEHTGINVIAQIKNFDLSKATPLMCMNFLAGIKSEL